MTFRVGVAVLFLSVAASVICFGFNIRLCVLSSITGLQSQCVSCSIFKYQQIIFTCTGQPYLPVNISQSQGVCLLDTCLRGKYNFRSFPLGRKKRTAEEELEPNNEEEIVETVIVNEDDSETF